MNHENEPMSKLPQSANPMTIAIARQLAAAHPQATLPCPLCPATVKAANLERHLGKTHAAVVGPETAIAPGSLRLSGADRRIRVPLVGLMILWALAIAALAVLHVAITDLRAGILGVSLLACFVLLFAALGDLFKARLEVEDERLRLRWGLGLGSRTVRLPAKIVCGRLLERKHSPSAGSFESGGSVDVDAGAYLELSSGGTTITVGSPNAAGVGKRWTAQGWSPGKKRRLWDIHVDYSSLVAIEYHLAARGQLTPRQISH